MMSDDDAYLDALRGSVLGESSPDLTKKPTTAGDNSAPGTPPYPLQEMGPAMRKLFEGGADYGGRETLRKLLRRRR